LTLVSAVGDVRMRRRYYACRSCGETAVPLDAWAGVEKGHLTTGAKRMATLAATSWSFDQASENLLRLCGVRISDQTIRRVALHEGVKAKAWQERSPDAAAALHQAEGVREFLTDGTMVNTREGWQEMRLSVFSKREPGESTDPQTFTELRDRHLPRPTASLALANKLSSERMGDLWQRMFTRLGWGDGLGVSVIADGAGWIATQTQRTLPRAQRVVDVYHVSQHLHECGQTLHEGDREAGAKWARRTLADLVRDGPIISLRNLERQHARCANPAHEKALGALLTYLRPHTEALRYGERLRGGLPIGSGQVEGACKTIVGRRLKLNSARWTPENTEPIAALCGLVYTDAWDTYWSKRAA
jgi:hypothetical protein